MFLFLDKLSVRYRRFVDYIVNHPFFLIPLTGPYLVATILVALVCNVTGSLAADLLWRVALSNTRHPYLDYQLAKLLFFFLGSLVWLHYLKMALSCFWAAATSRMTILGATQLVAVTILMFAAAHYYVALYGPSYPPSYTGVENPKPAGGWRNQDDFDDRLFFVPTIETVVDFVYFSAVTTSTVGYGDISPHSIWAKLLTILQIGTSFILVVVVLGRLIGKEPSLEAERSPGPKEENDRRATHN